MTKSDLVKQVSENNGLNRVYAEQVFDAFLSEISTVLESGETIFIRGFATIGVKTAKEKKAQNISRGTVVIIPEHKKPFVKFSKEVLNRVK